MTLEQVLGEAGRHLEAYHQQTGTSIDFRVYISEQQFLYAVGIATAQRTYEFKDPAVLLAWLSDVSANVDPQGSAMLRMQAEAVVQQKIILEAQEVALAKEISELPQTQVIKDAQAAASIILSEADIKLAKLAEAQAILQAEADAKATVLAEEIAKATPEELAKAEELIAAEKK
jgi:hypothetical protein